ncbi:MAG: tRNA (adenosine(37)-N6)-threonylcarbamoyltransferase complex dimerization subunit type 1 TsaB [Pirellulales bacterium]
MACSRSQYARKYSDRRTSDEESEKRVRILALETVDTGGSVAALDDARLLAEQALPSAQRSAQSLAPAIAAILAEVGWRPTDVQLVAVASGPGSFTGLRIGVTTAKAFAYAAGCELVGVHTMLAIAERAPAHVARLWVVLDAQRKELFATELLRDSAGVWREVGATDIVAADRWLAGLVAGSVVAGPGLSRVVDRVPQGVSVLDQALWRPTAGAVGAVGWRRYQAGERTSAFELLPGYVRRAAAEEKFGEKS